MENTNIITLAETDPENEEFRRIFDSPRKQAERQARRAEAEAKQKAKQDEEIDRRARAMAKLWMLQAGVVALFGVVCGLLVMSLSL